MPGRTYRWYNDSLLPFGHGLHYTDFSVSVASDMNASRSVSNLAGSCDRSAYKYLDLCPFAAFNVEVKSTGARASDYVALDFLKG